MFTIQPMFFEHVQNKDCSTLCASIKILEKSRIKYEQKTFFVHSKQGVEIIERKVLTLACSNTKRFAILYWEIQARVH